MEIAYHIGVNCTDGERLLRSLMRSADQLAPEGIALPGPGRYRRLLRETVQGLTENPPPAGARDVLIDAITDMGDARRLVLSNAFFFCQANRIFEGGEFYGMAEFKIRAFRQLFPEDTLSLHMAVRNPATFIPAVWSESRARSIIGYMNGFDPRNLRWAGLVRRIRAAAPDIPLTVWCNEDTPLIWNALLHQVAGLPEATVMPGAHDLLATIMQPEGHARFMSYVETHPPGSEAQLRRIIGAFLDKYAIPGEVEEEFDIAGWDAAMVADLTLAYEDDVEEIAAIPGVTLLTP